MNYKPEVTMNLCQWMHKASAFNLSICLSIHLSVANEMTTTRICNRNYPNYSSGKTSLVKCSYTYALFWTVVIKSCEWFLKVLNLRQVHCKHNSPDLKKYPDGIKFYRGPGVS